MPKFKSLTQYEQDVELTKESILELIPAEHKGVALGLLNKYCKSSKKLILRDVMNGVFSNSKLIKKKHDL